MKHILIVGTFLIFSFSSCGMALKSLKRERGDHDKYWHVCTPEETKNPLGKMCSRSCIKWIGNKCKKTKLYMKNLNDVNDHNFFTNKSMTCLDIDQL